MDEVILTYFYMLYSLVYAGICVCCKRKYHLRRAMAANHELNSTTTQLRIHYNNYYSTLRLCLKFIKLFQKLE